MYYIYIIFIYVIYIYIYIYVEFKDLNTKALGTGLNRKNEHAILPLEVRVVSSLY